MSEKPPEHGHVSERHAGVDAFDQAHATAMQALRSTNCFFLVTAHREDDGGARLYFAAPSNVNRRAFLSIVRAYLDEVDDEV